MKELITAVMTRLKEQVPALRWIDLNIGQMATDTPPVDYPCALIDVPTVDYSDAAQGVQLGKLTLEVELYFIVRTPGSMAAPEELRNQSLEHFDVAQQVYQALQGFSGETFTRLTRIRAARDKEYYPRCFRLTFECGVKDASAMTSSGRVPLRPAVSLK